MDTRIEGTSHILPSPILLIQSIPGPRTNLSHPHSSRNRAPKIPPHVFPLRSRQRLRRRASSRPNTPIRPQDHVPTHLLLGREQSTTIIHSQTPPQQQQTPLHPRQRPTLHPIPTNRYKRGHDGNLPSRSNRPAARTPQTYG